jgi:hypothetical protein
MTECTFCGHLIMRWWKTVTHPGCPVALKIDRILTGRW